MSEILDQAEASLEKALKGGQSAILAQAYAQGSMASSLLSIAKSLEAIAGRAQPADDRIELIVRRLLDGATAPPKKKEKTTK